MNKVINLKQPIVKCAVSQAKDPSQAAGELYDELFMPDCSCVVFFCSVHFDLDELSSCLARLFGDVKVIGCTTAGEITPLGCQSHTITGFSLPGSHFKTESRLIRNLASSSLDDTSALMGEVIDALKNRAIAPMHTQSFAISLLDGLSIQQEEVLQALSMSLNDIPLIGGSAGDDLLFKDTHVYWEGNFYSNAAVIMLINTDLPFAVNSEHHLLPDDEKLVVTQADPATREVQEINAEPAAMEYCRITGLSIEKLNPTNFAMNPLAVQFGDELYVRSIQKLNDDMSLTFFCAVDVGVVLTKAKSGGIVESTRHMFENLHSEIGPLELVIAYDCIHRKIEALQTDKLGELSKIYSQHKLIGFNTYGEQVDGKHVNDTLSYVAIGSGK